MTSMGIIEYAEANNLNAADLIASLNSDPEPMESTGTAQGSIVTPDGTYGNATYPVDYLDLLAENVRELAEAGE